MIAGPIRSTISKVEWIYFAILNGTCLGFLVIRESFCYASLVDNIGTKGNPWHLTTPPGTSEYQMYRDQKDGIDVIVCVVGTTTLFYDARCLSDLQAMLKAHGDWMDLGGTDEQKEAKPGTVEAWGRSPENPIGGWYGLKKGLRARFGVYVPPLMEALGFAELTHEAKNNRMRAIEAAAD